MRVEQKIEQLIQPTLEDMGYVLWGCEYQAQGQHSLLRIYIDKEDGIKVEDCEHVSHRVSAILDVEDPVPGNYRLEVSSPGIPRPLFYPWQYQRYQGEKIRFKLFKSMEGKRKLIGVILSATQDCLSVEIDGEPKEIDFSNIVKANLTLNEAKDG